MMLPARWYTRLPAALLLLALLFLGGPMAQRAYAADARGEPRVQRIDPVVVDGKLEMNAEVAFPLNSELQEAAEHGVPLHFTADLIITRGRWWWFDKTEVDTSITWRIVYNTLTRQWRAGMGELNLPVGSLEEAMQLVRNIRHWQVADSAAFEDGVTYTGQLRVRLDTSHLAQPFQVNVLNSRAWSPATPWADFTFSLKRDGQ